MIKYFYIATFFSVVSICGYLYYENNRLNEEYLETIKDFENNKKQMENIVDINKNNQVIYEKLKKDNEEIQKKYEDVSDQLAIILMNEQQLVNKLRKHDLETLSIDKTSLVENIINKSSKEYNECVAVITGLKDSVSETNNECQWLRE